MLIYIYPRISQHISPNPDFLGGSVSRGRRRVIWRGTLLSLTGGGSPSASKSPRDSLNPSPTPPRNRSSPPLSRLSIPVVSYCPSSTPRHEDRLNPKPPPCSREMHSRNGSMPPNLGAWLKQCLALLRRVFGSRKRLCSWLRRVLRRERSRDCGFRSCSRAAPASGKPQSTRYWPCPSSPVPSNTVVGRSTSQQTAVPIVHDFVTRRGYDGRGASDKDASYNVTLKPALTRLPLRELDGDPHLANAAQQVTPPPPRENAEALAKKFDEYKLETEFDGDVVVHTTGEWSPLSSSRSWTRSRWRKGEIVGAGGFGSVWLQEKMTEEEGGKRELRAVKMVPRMSLPEARKSQELYALVKLGGVGLQSLQELVEWVANESSMTIFLYSSSAGTKTNSLYSLQWSTSSTGTWVHTSRLHR